MKIYITKYTLTGKFGRPFTVDTEEKLKYDYENMAILLKEKKEEQKIKDQSKQDIYEIGDYDEVSGIITPCAHKLIIKGADIYDLLTKEQKKVC